VKKENALEESARRGKKETHHFFRTRKKEGKKGSREMPGGDHKGGPRCLKKKIEPSSHYLEAAEKPQALSIRGGEGYGCAERYDRQEKVLRRGGQA